MAELATDEELAAACECDRSVYVEGDEAIRKAFAPATIREWTSRTYGDSSTAKYSSGVLQVIFECRTPIYPYMVIMRRRRDFGRSPGSAPASQAQSSSTFWSGSSKKRECCFP